MTVKKHPNLPHFFTVDHPLLLHKLSLLRNKQTPNQQFRELVKEITILLAYEVTRDLSINTSKIETPLESMEAPRLEGKKPVILPILRAGIGMVDGFLSLMPVAKIGHIGLYRNEETLKPVSYYFKIPPNAGERRFYVCDPMLGTGGSAICAIDQLKEKGVVDLVFICLVASPEGARNLSQAHPDLPIYAASLDRELSDKGYILPGLGDAGDRLFGTQ